LVDNAETCANVALITRFGADWFRDLGTAESPGTTLVSVTGAVSRPHVLEVALGTPIRAILETAKCEPNPQALLLGGYGGTWLDGSHIKGTYANEYLKTVGANLGAGIMVVLPKHACGVAETHRIVKWMANESARQCGPCAFGLPAIAENLGQIAYGGRDLAGALAQLRERCNVIEGRGACHHPDGVVRMVRSALEVFATDIAHHVAGSPCSASRERQFVVSVPNLEHETELVWE
jgi:NADH:ubiquinone oxidoreductase subunit F (NADH-binding)